MIALTDLTQMKSKMTNPDFSYQLHFGYIGWTHPIYQNGNSVRIYPHTLQAFILQPCRELPTLSYESYTSNNGWSKPSHCGEITGTIGKAIALNGVKIYFEKQTCYTVLYRGYCNSWTEWKMNGDSLFCENGFNALEIKILQKDQVDNYIANTSEHTITAQKDYESSSLLNAIGLETGTDKSSKYHNYLVFYEQFFKSYRDNTFTLIEAGIGKGQSIKMWESYFPNANIIACDINYFPNIFKNASLFIGDASDQFFLHAILLANPPFIFVDDASHKWSHQILTFEEAFAFIEPGGFYICEDIHTSFGAMREKEYNDQALDAMTYFSQLASLCVNDAIPDSHPCQANINKRQVEIAKKIDFIIFRRHCVLIKKGYRD